jgi:hypothetical protein
MKIFDVFLKQIEFGERGGKILIISNAPIGYVQFLKTTRASKEFENFLEF